MKKRIISCLLTLSMAAMLTTACGSTNDNAKATTEENAATLGANKTETSTAELTEEEKALAAELVNRHVTQDDKVTIPVIEETIRLFKEQNTFEEGYPEIKYAADETGYVAEGYGWFEQMFGDAGIKVTNVQGAQDSEEELMGRGDLTFANRMLYPFLLNIERGADLVAVWVTANPAKEIVSVIVAADSEYESFSDLKGKKIASSSSSCPFCVTEELVLANGWTDGVDYEFVNTKEYVNALLAGEVDAIIYHPGTTVNPIILSGQAKVIDSALEGGVYVGGGGSRVIFTTQEIAEKYPTIVKAYLKVQELTKAYIYVDEEGAAQINEEVSRTPAASSIYWWDVSKETMFSTGLSLDEVQTNTEEFYEWLTTYDKAFEGEADLSDIYDRDYIE